MLGGHSGNPGGAVSSRRNKFEIVADILRLGKASRTLILYSSSLSFRLLDRYLTPLCAQGYLTVTHEDRKTVYCTTEKGKRLMERIDQVVEMLRKPKGGVMMKGTKITVLSKTIKTNKMPDIPGFIQAMKDMGAKVSIKDKTILVDLRHLGGKDE